MPQLCVSRSYLESHIVIFVSVVKLVLPVQKDISSVEVYGGVKRVFLDGYVKALLGLLLLS